MTREDQGAVASTSQPSKGIHYISDKLIFFGRRAGHKFSHPLGVKPEHVKYLRVIGQVGFVAKGVVYALIGGLSCQSAVSNSVTIRGADNSPQGAFILVGNNQFGYPLLIVMAITVFMYACWRFWEGITGQGSDDAFGKFKNFFKYRLSPLVSGCVYTAYGAFCISLIPRIKHLDTAAQSGGFPQSVAGSAAGDILIAILGLAFLIAFVTQMQAALTRNFHYEMKENLPTWFSWILVITGHVGFLGRSGVFLFVAILMFRTIANPDINNTNETTIGNALSQLQKTHAGRACLFILGFFLVVYGTFAVLNAYGKVFPTQPPSGRHVREDSSASAGQWERHTDQPDIEAPQWQSSPPTRKKSIGEPAWNHSDSKKKLHLEQIQLEALTNSNGGPHNYPQTPPLPGSSDYELRKQERMQALKHLEMTVLGSHAHANPSLSSNTGAMGSSHSPQHTHCLNDPPPSRLSHNSDSYVPDLSSTIAEIRVSAEDLPVQTFEQQVPARSSLQHGM